MVSPSHFPTPERSFAGASGNSLPDVAPQKNWYDKGGNTTFEYRPSIEIIPSATYRADARCQGLLAQVARYTPLLRTVVAHADEQRMAKVASFEVQGAQLIGKALAQVCIEHVPSAAPFATNTGPAASGPVPSVNYMQPYGDLSSSDKLASLALSPLLNRIAIKIAADAPFCQFRPPQLDDGFTNLVKQRPDLAQKIIDSYETELAVFIHTKAEDISSAFLGKMTKDYGIEDPRLAQGLLPNTLPWPLEKGSAASNELLGIASTIINNLLNADGRIYQRVYSGESYSGAIRGIYKTLQLAGLDQEKACEFMELTLLGAFETNRTKYLDSLEKASSIFGAIDRALKDLKLTTTTKLQARLEQAFLTSEKYFLIHKGTLEKVSSLLEERQYQRAFDILSKPNLAIYQIPRSETALPNNLAVLINREGSRSFRDLARVVETFAQKQTTEFYSQFFDLPSLSKEQVSTILDFRPSCFENDANIKAAIATVLVKVAAACIVGEAADKTNRNHFKRLLNYLTDQAGITGVRARGLEVLEICLAHEADTNPKFWSGGTLGHIDELRDMGFATWLIENDSRFKEIPLRYWENGKMAPKLASQVLLECCHGKLADACRGIANNHLENIRLDSVWDNQEFKDFAELRIFLDKNNIQTFGELHSFIRKIASLVSVDEKSALNSGGTGTSDEGASTDSESRRSADVEWGHVLELAPANWRDGVDTYAEEQRKKLVREHELQAELTARRLLEMEALRQHREFIRDSHTKQRGRDFER